MGFYKKDNENKSYSQQHEHGAKKPFDWAKGAVIVFLAASIVLIILLAGIFSSSSPMFGECVAYIKLNGELSTEGQEASLFSAGEPTSQDYASLIKSLEKSQNVKALVVEINSPGGSVVASQEIYEAMEKFSKPKVSYLREIAASGGYYVAVSSDKIVANPDVLTGSIGVIATFADLRGLFKKIGVEINTIKSGQYKDIGAMNREMTDDEKEILQKMINEIYQEFYGVVQKHRGEKAPLLDKIADGRIMTGRQALKYGLVDKLGNSETAVKDAADLAGMKYEEMPQICYYAAKSSSSPFAGMLSGFTINMEMQDSGLKIKT